MMAAPTQPKPQVKPADSSRSQAPVIPSDWVRTVVSVLLALHLTAVVIAPCAAPPPASELAGEIARRFEPYLFAAYLNHGYRFFAPNPGPSHLVRYELYMPDGKMRKGQFPDPDRHWPRQLYHRYFMVSETVFNLADIPDEPPPEGFLSRQQQQGYEAALLRRDTLVNGLAEHLLRRHGAARVRLYLVEHGIPSPEQVEQGMRLNDPQLYDERLLADVSGDKS